MKGINKNKNKQFKTLLTFQLKVKSRLANKYQMTDELYDITIINNIMYNEKSHIVALFKDYLILNDYSEFLKRYYTNPESKIRLPRFFEYYDSYSKIYPNYTHLYEGKFIYHNIQRKQKMIDLQERMEMEGKMKKKKKKDDSDEVFSTDIYDSIVNDRNNEDLEVLFNLHEKSIDFFDKVEEMIGDIEKNDLTPMTDRNPYNNNSNSNYSNNNNNNNSSVNFNFKSNHNTNKNKNNNSNTSNINNHSNIGSNPSTNHISMKHKLLISSLLRNKEINANNTTDRHPYLNNQHTNTNSRERKGYNNLSNHSNSNSQSKYMNPLTERPLSKNKMHDNYIKAANSRQSNHAKMLSDYPKTIIFNSSINAMTISKRNKEPKGLQMPLTQRDHHSRQHYSNFESNEFTLTKQNEIKRDMESTRHKSHCSPVKSPPKCTNNFIYIINQNPKFTTHVSLINNNQNNLTNHSVKLHSGKSSNVQSQSKLMSSKQPTGAIPSSDSHVKNSYPYYLEKKSAKTRNSNQFIHNNFMLKTARDNHSKELNLLRTSSQPSIPLKQTENFYTTKYQLKHHNIRPASNSKTKSSSNQHEVKGNLSTNKMQQNIATATYSTMNPVLKGIPIKNFSKVLNVNFSQSNTDRDKKNF